MYNDLIENIRKVHTTELGALRIKKNRSLDTDDVVEWCIDKIQSDNSLISRRGKNWYISVDGVIITVNASS